MIRYTNTISSSLCPKGLVTHCAEDTLVNVHMITAVLVIRNTLYTELH